jgi:hypothetical protein
MNNYIKELENELDESIKNAKDELHHILYGGEEIQDKIQKTRPYQFKRIKESK